MKKVISWLVPIFLLCAIGITLFGVNTQDYNLLNQVQKISYLQFKNPLDTYIDIARLGEQLITNPFGGIGLLNVPLIIIRVATIPLQTIGIILYDSFCLIRAILLLMGVSVL